MYTFQKLRVFPTLRERQIKRIIENTEYIECKQWMSVPKENFLVLEEKLFLLKFVTNLF